MASMIGIRVMPSGVIEYSERGGSSGYMVFDTNPSSTSSFSCRSSTRGVASGNILCSSLGRRVRCRSSSSIHDFHLESIRLMVSRRGQSKSTGIFLSYMVLLLLIIISVKITIICQNGSIPKIFSVYE